MAEIIKLGSTGNWGVKPNGVLAYNDENNVFKAIELQSSRASGATYVGEDGLIKDAEVGVPRIDWTNGVGELLLEPQSTNELTQSNGSDFNVTRCTRGTQSNKLGSVDGYEYSFTSANPNINKNYTDSTLGYKTLSVYFDSTNSDQCRLVLSTGGTATQGAGVTFTPSTETFGSITENATYVRNSSSGFENMGGGIYRVWLTTEFILYSGGTTFPIVYFGDNTNVWIGGLQVERLSYPTSLIRTEGSSATRIADAVTGNSSLGQVINSSEGTFYLNLATINDTDSFRITISDETSSNKILLGSAANQYYYELRGQGSLSTAALGGLQGTDFVKLAGTWKQDEFKYYINGTKIAEDTSGNTTINLSTIRFDNLGGSNPFYGKVKDLRVYDQALTDSELQALTS